MSFSIGQGKGRDEHKDAGPFPPAGVAFYKFFGEDVMRAGLSIPVPELGSGWFN